MPTHPLRDFREKQDPPLRRHGLAKLLGVSKVTLWRWETGARKISDDLLPEISRKTGIPVAKLRPDLARLMSRSTAEPAS